MFVCNYNRKTFVVDHRQKYVEIANDCLWIEIADERLQFLQTKHLQCRGAISGSLWKPLWLTSEVIEIERRERVQAIKLLSVWQQDAENISLLKYCMWNCMNIIPAVPVQKQKWSPYNEIQFWGSRGLKNVQNMIRKPKFW